MRLDGRCAVITGAGTALGQAVAVEAARSGLRLILVGGTPETLDATLGHLPKGADAEALTADITHPIGRRRVHDAVAHRFGHLHLLVCHADLMLAGALRELDDEDIAAAAQVNLVAPIALIRGLIDPMRAAAPARIVVLGSMLAEIGQPMFSAYAATKHGLRGMARALRRELVPYGIGVTYAAARPVWADSLASLTRLIAPAGLPKDDPLRFARRLMRGIAQERDSVYATAGDRLAALVDRIHPALLDRSIARDYAALRGLVDAGAGQVGAAGVGAELAGEAVDARSAKSGLDPAESVRAARR